MMTATALAEAFSAHGHGGSTAGADWYTAIGLAGSVTVAVLYASAAARTTHSDGPWPVPRTAAFSCGILLLAVTLFGNGQDDEMDLAFHIAQHMIVMMAVPPLLVAGQPTRLLLRSLSDGRRAAVAEILTDPAVRTLTTSSWGRLLLVIDYYGSMAVYLHTPLLKWSFDHQWAHVIGSGYFLLCGVFFWSALLEADSAEKPSFRSALAMTAIGVPANVLLGLSLLWGVPGHTAIESGPAVLVTVLGGSLLSAVGAAVIVVQMRRTRGRPELASEEIRWPAVS